MPKYRTKFQNSKLHGLANKIGLTKDDLHEHAFDLTNGRTEHTSELTIKECDLLIKHLESLLPKEQQPALRTVQHHRQKAGIKAIVTSTHLDRLNQLARGRGMTKEGLEGMCLRMIKVKKPRFTFECSKIIEAIKAMNARDKENEQNQKLKKEAA